MNIEFLTSRSPWDEEIHFFESLGSTNTRALELGEGGAAEGTILIAAEQTQGRGQFQRPWFSPQGTGIWMSLLLRPKIVPEIIPGLSRFAILALYDAILKMGFTIPHLKIKEPNDLLIGEKKLAGVLTETRLGASSFAVVGIGVNILQEKNDFPIELREKVTSLALSTEKKNIDCQKILFALLESLHERYQQLLYQPTELDQDWKERVIKEEEN